MVKLYGNTNSNVRNSIKIFRHEMDYCIFLILYFLNILGIKYHTSSLCISINPLNPIRQLL